MNDPKLVLFAKEHKKQTETLVSNIEKEFEKFVSELFEEPYIVEASRKLMEKTMVEQEQKHNVISLGIEKATVKTYHYMSLTFWSVPYLHIRYNFSLKFLTADGTTTKIMNYSLMSQIGDNQWLFGPEFGSTTVNTNLSHSLVCLRALLMEQGGKLTVRVL